MNNITDKEKQYIDKALSDGVSYEKLSELLKKKGIETTSNDLLLYNKGLSNLNVTDIVKDEFEPINLTNILSQFSGNDNFAIAHKILLKMFINQTVITYSLQEKYLLGEINKFPENELRNLKLIQEMIVSIEKYNDNNSLSIKSLRSQ